MLSDPATQDERYPFPVHYGRLLAVDGFLKDYQSAAEAEARRILAETEPGEVWWRGQSATGPVEWRGVGGGGTDGGVAWLGRPDWAPSESGALGALAESLARFCALESLS